MNRELIIDAISAIDEDIIGDCLDFKIKNEKKRRSKTSLPRIASAVAACLALAISLIYLLAPTPTAPPTIAPSPETLTPPVSESEIIYAKEADEKEFILKWNSLSVTKALFLALDGAEDSEYLAIRVSGISCEVKKEDFTSHGYIVAEQNGEILLLIKKEKLLALDTPNAVNYAFSLLTYAEYKSAIGN